MTARDVLTGMVQRMNEEIDNGPYSSFRIAGLSGLLDNYRAEVLAEVADMVLAAQVRNPLGEAEEHVNEVLVGLAAEVRRMGGAR